MLKPLLPIIALLFFFQACEFPTDDPIGNEPPAEFNLEYPSDENNLVHSYDVHLQWRGSYDNDGSIANYVIYLSETENAIAIDTVATSTRKYTIDSLKSETTYYWMIEAIDNEGASTTSETRTFTTDDPDGVPNPIFPANGAIDVEIPVTFKFEEKNALIDGYEIYVSKASGGDNIMVSRTTSDLEPDTEYYWWVIGVDDSKKQNSMGHYWRGNMASFTTKK